MSCFKCCHACFESCCSFLNKEKEKSTDYPHIQYSTLQDEDLEGENIRCSSELSTFSMPQATTPGSISSLPRNITPGLPQFPGGPLPIEKIFSFPQAKTEYAPHPQILNDKEETIIDEPKGRKFSAQSSISSVSEYAAVVRTGSLTRSGSLPRSESPAIITPPRRTSVSVSELDWMPSLPVLQEQSLECDDVLPSLQFSLHYDIQRSMLSVHLHHAANLPAMDKRGTSDPFIVIFLVPNREEIFESHIVPKSLDPIFDQCFDFKKLTPDDIRRQTLVFRVYDHDKFSKNDMIGGVALPLQHVDLFGVVMRMRIEQESEFFKDGDSKGDLLVALCYNPRLGSLKGVVLKATNLKKQDIVGLADPYVKVNFLVKGSREDKWKTSVKRNTLVPVFNESFHFNISNIDPQDVTLELFVMDYDRFSRDDAMGIVLIGSNVKPDSGQKHWSAVLESPQQSISHWHSILPVAQHRQSKRDSMK